MKVTPAPLPGLVVMEPDVFDDERGYLYESFSRHTFTEATGEQRTWAQDNHSFSVRDVLRGLHYQLDTPQGKIVRCIAGSIYDVAVDVRRSSPTFAEWFAVELSAENRRMLWVPEGFAHGFLVTSDAAEVTYKMTERYQPDGNRAIRWDDPDLAIPWPIDGTPILSPNDAVAPFLADADTYA